MFSAVYPSLSLFVLTFSYKLYDAYYSPLKALSSVVDGKAAVSFVKQFDVSSADSLCSDIEKYLSKNTPSQEDEKRIHSLLEKSDFKGEEAYALTTIHSLINAKKRRDS